MMQCWAAQKELFTYYCSATQGCWIYTPDGKKYMTRSEHECINLGFSHPEVILATRSQLEKVIDVTDDFATERAA